MPAGVPAGQENGYSPFPFRTIEGRDGLGPERRLPHAVGQDAVFVAETFCRPTWAVQENGDRFVRSEEGASGIGREGKLTTANRGDKGFLGGDLGSTVCNRLPEGFTVHFVPGACRDGILKNGFRALSKTAGFVRKTGGEAFLRRGAAVSRSGGGEKDRFCCGRTAGRAGYAETKCVLRDDGRTEVYVVRRGKKIRLPGLETTGLWPGGLSVCLSVCLSVVRTSRRSKTGKRQASEKVVPPDEIHRNTTALF